MGTLTEDLKAYRQKCEMRDDAKTEYEDLKAECDQLQIELLERMEAEGVDSQKTGGINFVPATTTYGNVADRAAFIEWCERTGNDELLERKERKGLINQLAREYIDNGEPLPDGMNSYQRKYISQRADSK